MKKIRIGFAVLSLIWVSAINAQTLEDEAVRWLQDFIRVDTKAKKVFISEIFKWYREDFLQKDKNDCTYIL